MAPWALNKGRSAAPAAWRLTPQLRPVPCARSTPPPSPRSAWRALSHLRTLSLPREPRRMGAPESLSPGLTPAHLRPSLPARKKEHPGRPRESGRRKRRLSFEERGAHSSQNTAALAAALRHHTGISLHAVRLCTAGSLRAHRAPPNQRVPAAPQSPPSRPLRASPVTGLRPRWDLERASQNPREEQTKRARL